VNIIKKAQEWATAYGSILNVSAETRLPWLYKGAVGGLEHVISADNGGAYIELWRDGTGSYYATTGAKITQMPGLAKGAKLDEALDKFFAMTAKATVKKGKTYRDRQGVTQPSARTKSPLKKHETPKAPYHSHNPGQNDSGKQYGINVRRNQEREATHGHPPKFHDTKGKNNPAYHRDTLGHTHKALRKNIIDNVDPQIGPQFSVGHMKPSDLSPESSMKNKAIRKCIRDIGKAMTGGRIGADGKVTPEKSPGMGGVGQPTGYGATGMPHYSYQRKARKAFEVALEDRPPMQSGTKRSELIGAPPGVHGHGPGFSMHSHRGGDNPEHSHHQFRGQKKNIVGLSGRGGAGASSGNFQPSRINRPVPHGRMVQTADPKNYPFPGQPHGSEGIHSHDYGKNKRGTHEHGVPGMDLPHSAVGTRSNFHNENMWLKPMARKALPEKTVPAKTYQGQGFSGTTPARRPTSPIAGEGLHGKGYAKAMKKCTPCELKKAVRAATKAVATPGGVEKTKRKAKIPSEAHSEHVYESYKGVPK